MGSFQAERPDKSGALRLLIFNESIVSRAACTSGPVFAIPRSNVGANGIVLKRDKSFCSPIAFFAAPFSTRDDSPFASRYPSNIRRQIIAAINSRLIEPNAACRCLLLSAKSISHYKSIGPFLSFISHLPCSVRSFVPPPDKTSTLSPSFGGR